MRRFVVPLLTLTVLGAGAGLAMAQGGGAPQNLGSRVLEDTSAANDTGQPALLVVAGAVVAVVAVAAFAYAIIAVVEMGTKAVDRASARGTLPARMMELHKAALNVISDHAKREVDAGHPIPFTAEERGLLQSLDESQRALATSTDQPFPTPFGNAAETFAKGAGAGVENVGDAARKAAEAAAKAAENIPYIAAGAAAIFGIALIMRR